MEEGRHVAGVAGEYARAVKASTTADLFREYAGERGHAESKYYVNRPSYAFCVSTKLAASRASYQLLSSIQAAGADQARVFAG